MKVLALVLLAAVVCAQEEAEISAALESEKALLQYTNCLLDKGDCTEGMKKIKELIPKLVQNNCESCTKEQKELGKSAINLVKTNYPNIFEDLQKHFDPEGKHIEELEKFIST